MILQKYFAALLSIAIVVMTALLAIPSGQVNGPAVVQLVSVGVAGIGTYLLPLLNITWKGILKTGIAVIGAIISVLYPLLVTHGAVNGTEIALMVLAALNALGVEVGVQIRTDQSTLMPVDPTPTTSVNQITLSDTDRNLLASAIAAPAMALSGAQTPADTSSGTTTQTQDVAAAQTASTATTTASNPANAMTESVNLANLTS